MTKNDIIRIAREFTENYPTPQLSEDMKKLLGREEFCFFDAPVIGFASADDIIFEEFKNPDAVGSHFIAPKQWMENAKSVVSIFVPYSDGVKKANTLCANEDIAPEYVYAKEYAVPFLNELMGKIISAVQAEGFSVVVPTAESDRMKLVPAADGTKPMYTSRWSERHIAYACGMGSFGISGGLITEKGCAGRFVSFVTDMPLEADTRTYTDPYEQCTMCGACIARCPVGAISVENKKDKAKCSAFVNTTKEKFAPLYGCAKCQCGVPCANGKPKAE